MTQKINPIVDCVFKAILGDEKKTHLPVHFLNSVLGTHHDPDREITEVSILNPYNEKEFEDDKLSIVDIKAQEASGRRFLIEIQLTTPSWLAARMLYAWTSVYYPQLKKGDDYTLLKPVTSIWILEKSLFPDIDAFHIPFYAHSPEYGVFLNDHFSMHVLQLAKWKLGAGRVTEKDRWMRLFREGRDMDIENPPEWINESREMRDVMEILERFVGNQKDFLLYQNRMQSEMLRRTIERDAENSRREMENSRREMENSRRELENSRREMEQLRREKEAAQQEKEAAQQEKEAAQQEKEAAQQEKEAAQQEKEAAQQEKEAAQQEKEAAQQEKEDALAEIARLKKALAEAGWKKPL